MHDARGRKGDRRKGKQRGMGDSPKSGCSEGHGAPNVHGVPQDVKWEALDSVVHEDTKVVPEERTGYTQDPVRCYNEDLAGGEEHSRHNGIERLREELHLGLVL